jgi:hypothetical protein
MSHFLLIIMLTTIAGRGANAFLQTAVVVTDENKIVCHCSTPIPPPPPPTPPPTPVLAVPASVEVAFIVPVDISTPEANADLGNALESAIVTVSGDDDTVEVSATLEVTTGGAIVLGGDPTSEEIEQVVSALEVEYCADFKPEQCSVREETDTRRRLVSHSATLRYSVVLVFNKTELESGVSLGIESVSIASLQVDGVTFQSIEEDEPTVTIRVVVIATHVSDDPPVIDASVVSEITKAAAEKLGIDHSLIEDPVITVTLAVTTNPTPAPTGDPTASPTGDPTPAPTGDPTASPTGDPTASPTGDPTASPTGDPTASPTGDPTASPTGDPTASPTAFGGDADLSGVSHHWALPHFGVTCLSFHSAWTKFWGVDDDLCGSNSSHIDAHMTSRWWDVRFVLPATVRENATFSQFCCATCNTTVENCY